jgi:translation initiation factor IF-3
MAPRMNEQIDTPRVLLIGLDGVAMGIVSVVDALATAREHECELVEVQPTANPPVCKLMSPDSVRHIASRRAKNAEAQRETRSLLFQSSARETDIRLRLWHAREFLVQDGAIELRIIGSAARAFARDLVNRLSDVGELHGDIHSERDEIVALLHPRVGSLDEANTPPTEG